MADYNTPAFTWVIESSTPSDGTIVRTTIETDGVNPPSFTVAMGRPGSDTWLSGDWLAPTVTMDPPWDEPGHFRHDGEPRPVGFVNHNGAGEIVFRQAGHPGNDPGPPWAPVYLAVEAGYEACFCDYDPAGQEHDRRECREAGPLASTDPVELAWHERTRHDRP